ncbi:MAG: hypothetical protein GWO24_29660, partial [Akkermansiaceae bacterium]|nr:hypothetical protein [Akkermansiaceae bacterium]
EMKQHIGGQPVVAGDNNPILQGFTVTEITVPPAPESLALAPAQFFIGQSAAVGTLTTEDAKRNPNHLYSFSGSGGADNDKFEITDDQVMPGPYDFSAHSPGE